MAEKAKKPKWILLFKTALSLSFIAARQRFVVGSPVNREVGLPLYYVAQFLLAFSAAWIPG
ncbi:MAG: hypothetical protein KFF68_08325 [Desulfosarcina sp.]|nr:hypothetical protein [Desulfosarcina sp.]